MRSRGRLLVWSAGAISLLILFGFACIPNPVSAQEFSAQQISTTRGVMEMGELFYRPDRWRVEMDTQDFPAVTIYRLDKKVIWTLLPRERKYVEIPLADDDLPLPTKIPGEIERQVVGQELVEGFVCDKLVIRYSRGDEIREIFYWIPNEIGVSIRTEMPDVDWKSELKQIRMGPQADALFEVPSGFELFIPPLDFVR